MAVKYLRATVAAFNERAEDDGFLVRLIEQGRNGYQAIDEFPVDGNGKRIGSGVNRNVCCGTSRECIEAVSLWYYQTFHNYAVTAAKKVS